tara:strand:- start:23 stop:505 length:483 start_codon:yes stop_codon:yes gene_type:complete
MNYNIVSVPLLANTIPSMFSVTKNLISSLLSTSEQKNKYQISDVLYSLDISSTQIVIEEFIKSKYILTKNNHNCVRNDIYLAGVHVTNIIHDINQTLHELNELVNIKWYKNVSWIWHKYNNDVQRLLHKLCIQTSILNKRIDLLLKVSNVVTIERQKTFL